jgi:hypothetical protein
VSLGIVTVGCVKAKRFAKGRFPTFEGFDYLDFASWTFNLQAARGGPADRVILLFETKGTDKGDGQTKGTDLFSSILSWSAPLPVLNPPSNDCLYFIGKSLGSSQLPSLQRLTDQLSLTRRYGTLREFPVAYRPFIVMGAIRYHDSSKYQYRSARAFVQK